MEGVCVGRQRLAVVFSMSGIIRLGSGCESHGGSAPGPVKGVFSVQIQSTSVSVLAACTSSLNEKTCWGLES
jgi:hypothetical protein